MAAPAKQPTLPHGRHGHRLVKLDGHNSQGVHGRQPLLSALCSPECTVRKITKGGSAERLSCENPPDRRDDRI